MFPQIAEKLDDISVNKYPFILNSSLNFEEKFN